MPLAKKGQNILYQISWLQASLSKKLTREWDWNLVFEVAMVSNEQKTL